MLLCRTRAEVNIGAEGKSNTGNPQIVTVCFAMSHKNNGFETRRSKISKSYKNVKNSQNKSQM
jgi:hypothetical protein